MPRELAICRSHLGLLVSAANDAIKYNEPVSHSETGGDAHNYEAHLLSLKEDLLDVPRITSARRRNRRSQHSVNKAPLCYSVVRNVMGKPRQRSS